MTQQPVADIVALFTLIAALIFSNEVAGIVGPYMVIVVAATLGASFKVARREKSTRTSAVLFFLRVVGMAVIFTAGFAAALNAYRPDLSPRVTVAPIALLIGFVDWPLVLGKVVGWGASALERMAGGKGGAS
ncbi:hypothetical protein J2W28_000982 [Variovorax boronicumulans]|uniref:hypothetical protein n=1 Tax=Variovorax boronicumulans TaxID=436515 RepID=UPI002787F86E|nr:hypothetical protein [Variovorax boronicumulans]MDP9991954.1 hypothetical protein [Variovorax boronicumulans]MDQ0001849.1 hypothetical protein [Variovorax boronicumulans]